MWEIPVSDGNRYFGTFKEGSKVKKGEPMLIIESMKMENELRSPRDGIISQIKVEAGATVEKDQVLVVITD